MFYTFEELEKYVESFDMKELKKLTKSKKGVKYYNIPCAFDIESSSYYIDTETGETLGAVEVVKMRESGAGFSEERYEKMASMYVWMLSINDSIIIGRTWGEFKKTIERIAEVFELSDTLNLIIYVHNLAFEFQFLKSVLNFEKVFASDAHKVIYAISGVFEFRCSYFLAGCSLETVAKNLTKYKASKQVGLLDYNKVRTQATPLTSEELTYCIYDVIVLSNFIRESMEEERGGSILKLPLTKTGYVRRYCKRYTLGPANRYTYKKIMKKFKYTPESFEQLKRCYAGAFTHANAINVDMVFENVSSFDFTSSYPFCLAAFKYPMSRGYDYEITSLKDFYYNLKKYCCVFDIYFENIRQREDVFENIISRSKCTQLEDFEENNGRIVYAKKLATTINEVDFESISRFYTWDGIKVKNFKRYTKGYLPREFVECIIHFYKGKTELKDVDGKENEYALLKGMLNSIYGMCVTDPVRDLWGLDESGEWNAERANLTEAVDDYNNAENRFIAYEWGIWCTSYARRNLYTGIIALGSDFIYADTDSLKFTNLKKHAPYFEKYNTWVVKTLQEMCEVQGFEFEDFAPKTKDGKTKIIGLYDYEGDYDRFKTLGAKRYAYEKGGRFNITVAGVNKKQAVPYMQELAELQGCDIFEIFTEDLYVKAEKSGKMLHSYLKEKTATVTDYMGNVCEVVERSAVHLEPTSYSLSISDAFKKYLSGLQPKYRKGI